MKTTKHYNVWVTIEEVTITDDSEDYNDLDEIPTKVAQLNDLSEAKEFIESIVTKIDLPN